MSVQTCWNVSRNSEIMFRINLSGRFVSEVFSTAVCEALLHANTDAGKLR